MNFFTVSTNLSSVSNYWGENEHLCECSVFKWKFLKVAFPFLCWCDAISEPLSVAFSCFCVHAVSLNPESLWDNEVQYSYILFPDAYYARCWCNPTSLFSIPVFWILYFICTHLSLVLWTWQRFWRSVILVRLPGNTEK